MDLTEALNIVEQVKSRYQAFEKLEEVIATARGVEGNLAAQKQVTADLVTKHDATKSALDDLETQLNKRRVQSTEELRQLDEDTQKQKESLNQALQDHTARVSAQVELVNQKRANAEASHQTRIQELEQEFASRRDVLEKEVAAMTSKHQGLKSALEALKAKFI